ncbi:transposase [Paenibacillus sp. S25]|uniref:transposase n=1 Tax=Paenibacillus sp. S25 TaxID=2823905 RepID=UPI001C64B1D6
MYGVDFFAHQTRVCLQTIKQAKSLKDEDLKTAKAYHLKLTFSKLWKQETPEKAEVFLDSWYFWATHNQIPDMVKSAKTIRQHATGILKWFTSKITNGIMEVINGLIQCAKRRAHGYRSLKNLKTTIYLFAGRLKLKKVEI